MKPRLCASPSMCASFVVVSCLLLWCSTALAQDKPSAQKGKKVYETYCASCHGTTGAADGPTAAVLDPKPTNFRDAKLMATRKDAQLLAVIRDGGKAHGKSAIMAPYKKILSEEDIKSVLLWLRTFGKP